MEIQKIFIIMIYINMLIMVLSAANQKRFISKPKEDLLYNHSRKSMIEAYNFLMICPISFIILDLVYKIFIPNIYFISIQYLQESLGTDIAMLMLTFLIIFLSAVVVSHIVYIISEVKHLSLFDSIGYKNQENLYAKLFFSETVLMGIFITLMMEVLICYNGIAFFITVNLIVLVVFLLGMADLLQHEDYYKWDYKEKRKTYSIWKKCYITTIYNGLSTKQAREKTYSILRENLKNIILGSKELYNIINNKQKDEKSLLSDNSE